MKDQGSEFVEHNLVCRNIGLVCSWKKQQTTLSNITGQLWEDEIIGKGELVLRELDLAVYQVRTGEDAWILSQ